jgi:RHS repeat-associated protein
VTGATTTFAYVVNGDGTRQTTVTYPPTSYEPAFSPTVVDSYTAAGWLTNRVSRPSVSETLTESLGYDTTGNQTSLTDPRGNTTDLCYDVDFAGATIPASRGNLTRLIEPEPTIGANRPVVLFAYDQTNNPILIVAPGGVPSGTSVTCSTDLAAINPLHASDLAYDALGANLLSTTTRFTDPDTGPQIAVAKFEYADPSNPGMLTRLIPPRGNTGPSPDYTYATTLSYGATGSQAGMLVAATDALGNTTTYQYDVIGRQIGVVDALGNAAGGVPAEHSTEFAYDAEDRVRFASAPSPQPGGSALVTELRYDAVGNRTVQIDANGQVTTYAYDERDGLFHVNESPLVWTDPAVPPVTVITTEYAYDAVGNLTRMVRAKGDAAAERATDYAYDGRGLVRRETQYPSWPATTPTLVTTSAYDPNGNPTTLVDPLGQTTTSSYDRLNRLVAIDYSSPSTPDVSYGFDANGNRTSTLDGTGSTSYVYDEADRLTTVTSPGATTVAYRYDLDGNRTKLIYPDSTAVTYSFDKGSRLESLQDWAARSVSYEYWPDGALKTATNPDASVATYTYDNARRVTDILHQQGITTIGQYTYGLDAVGNVIGLQDGAQSSTYGLDRLYRLTDVTGPDGNRTYGYDAVGNRTSLAAGGTTTYAYDRADRITSLQGPPVPGSSTRPPASNDAGWTSSANAYSSDNAYATAAPMKNKTKTVNLGTFGFDTTIPANATITGVTVSVEWKVSTTNSDATLGAGAYVNGSPVGSELVSTAEPIADTSQSFTVSGLTRAQLLNGAFVVRVRATRGSSNTAFTASLDAVSVTVDYMPPATVTLTSNANGNLVAKGADAFAYDQANRLTSANVAGNIETYAYDGDGVRFSRTVGGGPAIRYVSDVNTSLPVTIDDGSRKYVWGLGLAYAVSGSSIDVYHADRLGSVRAISDATGAVIATYRTDEFGVPTGDTGSGTQPLGFTGAPRDGTGLSYLRARYYDPSLGRFMSRDGWAGSEYAPRSTHRFTYVGNNPTTDRDPSGHFCFVACAIVGAIAGAGAYIGGVVVGNVIAGNGLSLEGATIEDAVISGVSGGIIGLTGGLALSTQIVVGGVVGGTSSAVSMTVGGRVNSDTASLELALGVVSGMAGPLLDKVVEGALRPIVSATRFETGSLVVGGFRGIVGGAGLNGLNNWILGRESASISVQANIAKGTSSGSRVLGK